MGPQLQGPHWEEEGGRAEGLLAAWRRAQSVSGRWGVGDDAPKGGDDTSCRRDPGGAARSARLEKVAGTAGRWLAWEASAND